MGAPAWGSRGGDRPRLLRMTPLRHSFAAPATPPAPPPRTHDYASDADTNKKGIYSKVTVIYLCIVRIIYRYYNKTGRMEFL